jgi:hypothetical protein
MSVDLSSIYINPSGGPMRIELNILSTQIKNLIVDGPARIRRVKQME